MSTMVIPHHKQYCLHFTNVIKGCNSKKVGYNPFWLSSYIWIVGIIQPRTFNFHLEMLVVAIKLDISSLVVL